MNRRDISIIILLFLIILLTYHSIQLPTSEDAYIMFRYAKNLAGGNGLVWNIGEDPVEGATGFLWTLLLAVFYKAGITFDYSVPILSGFILATIVIVMYFFLTRLFHIHSMIVMIAMASVATSPLVIQMRAGFETPLFSFFMIILTLSSALLLSSYEKFRSFSFYTLPISGLFLSLTRPEGVILFFLTSTFSLIGVKQHERLLLLRQILVWFFIPGILYFLWRFLYFGYPLPNTFYAKRITEKSLFEIVSEGYSSLLWLLTFISPYVGTIFVSLLVTAHQKKLILLLSIPLLLFPLSYFSIFQAQNIGNRYQISILPSLLIPFSLSMQTLLLHAVKKRVKWIKTPFLFLVGILLVFFSFYHTTLLDWDGGNDDRVVIGKSLQAFAPSGHTMVSSEAGALPFYAEWNAVDPAGHYDEYIAHHGLSEAYLDTIKPELIMFHDSYNTGRPTYLGGKWDEMVKTLRNYVSTRNYIVAAVIEKAGANDTHWYYVKTDTSERDAIIHAITTHDDFTYAYKKQ